MGNVNNATYVSILFCFQIIKLVLQQQQNNRIMMMAIYLRRIKKLWASKNIKVTDLQSNLWPKKSVQISRTEQQRRWQQSGRRHCWPHLPHHKDIRNYSLFLVDKRLYSIILFCYSFPIYTLNSIMQNIHRSSDFFFKLCIITSSHIYLLKYSHLWILNQQTEPVYTVYSIPYI